MRHISLVLLVVLLLSASAATAASFSLDSVFAQVYGKKVTVVDAGVGTYATYHAECGGPQTATAKEPGNLQALMDKYEVTAGTRWLKVVTLVKDVKDREIRGIDQAFVTDDGIRTTSGIICKVTSANVIWIDTWSLPCLVRLTPMVIQNASKKEHKILLIFTHTEHFNRENTVDVFIDPKNITGELEGLILDQPQLGLDMSILDGYKELPKDSEFRRLFRSYVYTRYTSIDLSETSLPYTITSDGRSQRVHGQQEQAFRAEIAKLTAAFNAELESAKKTIEKLAAESDAQKPKNWILKAGPSPTGAWALWVSKDGEVVGPQYIADQNIVVRGGPGIYYAEVKPWELGCRFESWTRYDITSAGQQLEVR